MVNTIEDIVTEDETKINVSQLKNNLFTYQLEEIPPRVRYYQ